MDFKTNEIIVPVKSFLTRQFLFEFTDQITDETDLFQEGIVDSFGFIELIGFLEKEFNIKFSDEELISGQFNSFNKIIGILSNKINNVINKH